MSDKEQQKICGVCGDKAIAKNFGAVSCESCKAFFRRNASKTEVYKCYFDEKCKIDSVTRKFCRKCRLRKCFEIGMKQEWILNDEEKQVRKKKIEEKRQKRRKNSLQSSVNSDSTASSSPETFETETSLEIFDNSITDDDIITNIMEIENFITNETEDTDEISDDVYQKAVELEFAVIPIARPLPENYYTLNDVECNRLSELFSALTIMQKPNTENVSELTDIQGMCAIMAAKTEDGIKKMVSVTKSLSSFNIICENDQISLLKYGCLEIFCLRSVLCYDYDTGHWAINLDDKNAVILKMELFKEDKSGMYDVYSSYLKKMGKLWDSDPYILDLLTAIVLFNPDRPNLLHRDVVKLQQQMYMYLLQRYLLLRYRSECESKEKFLRLLNILNDLIVLKGIHNKKRSECKAIENVGPLLREILEV